MAEPEWKQNFREYFGQVRVLLPKIDMRKFHIKNIPVINMELGRKHLEAGNMQDAALRYRIVTWFEPNNHQAWTGYGIASLMQGKKLQAERALKRALSISPGFEAAMTALNSLRQDGA